MYVPVGLIFTWSGSACLEMHAYTVKILKFGTPKTIAILVLKVEKFDVALH